MMCAVKHGFFFSSLLFDFSFFMLYWTNSLNNCNILPIIDIIICTLRKLIHVLNCSYCIFVCLLIELLEKKEKDWTTASLLS